jgi:hypothetical protein
VIPACGNHLSSCKKGWEPVVGKLCTYQCWFLAPGDDGYLGIGMGASHCPQYCLPLAWGGLSGLGGQRVGNQRVFVAFYHKGIDFTSRGIFHVRGHVGNMVSEAFIERASVRHMRDTHRRMADQPIHHGLNAVALPTTPGRCKAL